MSAFMPSRVDARCSSALHVPGGGARAPLLIAVHGTGREAQQLLDAFTPFADRHGLPVLAPLLPVETGGRDAYKAVADQGIRFDLILLGMIADARREAGLDDDRVLLAGFSGGAQLVHRFTLLHPKRVRGAAVAAPGRVTLPTDDPWPIGIGDVAARFGAPLDLEAIRDVPFGVVVGAEDTGDLSAFAADPRELRAGADRVERARALVSALEGLGAPVRFETVPGAGHDLDALVPPMVRFLETLV
jgi:pimeloyl-ACP methyl ester carboxylesterase